MKNLARSTAIIGLWGLAWGSAGEAQAGKAPAVPFHYHYVDVSSSIPYGYWYFDAWKLTNDEHDYGTRPFLDTFFLATHVFGQPQI